MDKNMEIGLVGLGKMGKGLAMNMMRNGYKIIVQNRSPGPVDEAVANGARRAESIPALVGMLKPKRIVWLMLTAGEPTESAIRELSGLLSVGDIIIDGAQFAVQGLREDARTAQGEGDIPGRCGMQRRPFWRA